MLERISQVFIFIALLLSGFDVLLRSAHLHFQHMRELSQIKRNVCLCFLLIILFPSWGVFFTVKQNHYVSQRNPSAEHCCLFDRWVVRLGVDKLTKLIHTNRGLGSITFYYCKCKFGIIAILWRMNVTLFLVLNVDWLICTVILCHFGSRHFCINGYKLNWFSWIVFFFGKSLSNLLLVGL